MSQITINEKNFARFSERMSKILQDHTNGQISLGKLQSQELFSQILGSENVHELRINLKKEKLPKDYTFKIDEKEVYQFFNKQLNTEQEKEFIEKLGKRMEYVTSRIADICGYEFNEWNYPLKQSKDGPSILNCIAYSYYPSDDDFKTDMQEEMQFGFEYGNKKVITYDRYIGSFPTKWLHQDFENQLIDETKAHITKELRKEENQDILRIKMK